MKALLSILALVFCLSAHAQFNPWNYETVAAGQTTQTLGPVGGKLDYIEHLIIVPATTSPGVVQIKDGGDTAITVFTGGTVSDIKSFIVQVGMRSRTGAWQVTTGNNVSVIAVGWFK